jgi:membrane associated rhomboid family serine protease
MLGVFIFGQVLEQVWGPKRFLIFYILTGLGAALAQYVVIHFSASPLIDSIDFVQNNLTQKNLEALLSSSDFRSSLSYSTVDEFNNFVNRYNSAMSDYSPEGLSLASQFLVDYKSQYLNSQVIVGASGSLFGLLGAFGMLFPNRELLIYFLFPIKAKWLVLLYGGFEIFSGIRNNPEDNVAHFAHIGGLLVGIILVFIWRKDRQHFY